MKSVMVVFIILMSLCVYAQETLTFSYDKVIYNGRTIKFKDSDVRKFKAVKIGTQIWMAQNLNDDVLNDACPGDTQEGCDNYGGLFLWQSAMNACPEGWRLPSSKDFHILSSYVKKHNHGEGVGRSLKSRTGWDAPPDEKSHIVVKTYVMDKATGVNTEVKPKNGTDRFGFDVLPEENNFWVSDSRIERDPASIEVKRNSVGELYTASSAGTRAGTWSVSSTSDDFEESVAFDDIAAERHSVRCIKN
jgi:uncharacterized protein (TIGR02145 family)